VSFSSDEVSAGLLGAAGGALLTFLWFRGQHAGAHMQGSQWSPTSPRAGRRAQMGGAGFPGPVMSGGPGRPNIPVMTVQPPTAMTTSGPTTIAPISSVTGGPIAAGVVGCDPSTIATLMSTLSTLRAQGNFSGYQSVAQALANCGVAAPPFTSGFAGG